MRRSDPILVLVLACAGCVRHQATIAPPPHEPPPTLIAVRSAHPERVRPVLERAAADTSELVREHAVWALGRAYDA